MTTNVKVMQLASFVGNVGDLVNHLGFRPWFEELIGCQVHWVEKEIRGYFRGDWHFDKSFIDEVNQVDLLVIGGGNFFEMWPEESSSGTSIDLIVEDFEKIIPPIFINSIGVDNAQGISVAARRELPRLLSYLMSHPNRLVSVRNDGSVDAVRDLIGSSLADSLIDLPDAGFFLPEFSRTIEETPTVGINLACDMPHIRFPNGQREAFVEAIAGAVEMIHKRFPLSKFRLFPHVYSDYSIFASLLEALPDQLRREKVEVMGNLPNSARFLANGYSSCTCVMSNRFHSSVIPIGFGIPTLGIVTYPQIQRTFVDLNLDGWCVDGYSTSTLCDEIAMKLGSTIEFNESSQLFLDCVTSLRIRRRKAGVVIAEWLRSVGLSR